MRSIRFKALVASGSATMHLGAVLRRSAVFAVLVASLLTHVSARADDNGGIPLHGFADAGGGSSTANTPLEQRVRGFNIGTIDFYLAPEFDDKVKSLMELAFEPNHANGSIGVDIERLQVGYTLSDFLTLWVGRFHTPLGYWNTAFHHGAQLQTSIYRPKFIEFEDHGGVIPAHSTGLWGKGQAKIGSGKLIYNIYVANGSRIVPAGGGAGTLPGNLDMNEYRTDKDRSMFGGSLAWDFGDAIEGLQIGLHGFSTEIDSYTIDDYSQPPTSTTDVQMTGAYLYYENNHVELISEYYGFSNKDLTVNSTDTTAKKSNLGFVQLAYAINDLWKPYVRWERASVNRQDNYFVNQVAGQPYTRTALGVRYDISPKAALKFEFTETSRKDEVNVQDPVYRIYSTQYAIRF